MTHRGAPMGFCHVFIGFLSVLQIYCKVYIVQWFNIISYFQEILDLPKINKLQKVVHKVHGYLSCSSL